MTINLGKPTDPSAFHRKFRWTFEGKDKDGNISFPQSFVKMRNDEKSFLESRPFQNEITFTSFFTMYEEKGKARQEFDKINNTAYDTVSGSLNLYDGCGSLMEEWKIEGIKLTSSFPSEEFPEIDYHENIIVDWHIFYEKLTYINYCKPISDVTKNLIEGK